MITWERTSLSFLQNELILGHGVEEHFYEGLDGTCGGDSGEGAGMSCWEGEARCGLHLLRCSVEQSMVSPGAEQCAGVVWSQQKGGPWALVLLFLHIGALATLFCERVEAAEWGEKIGLKAHNRGDHLCVCR